MSRQITIGQLIGSIITVILAIAGAWYTLSTEVTTLKTNQSVNVQRFENIERKMATDDAEKKLELREQQEYRDETLKLLYEIKLELQKKQDKRQ